MFDYKRLDELCHLVTDGTHDTPKTFNSGVPFIKGIHVKQGRIDFDNSEFISKEDHEKIIQRSKPELGDILLANIGVNIGETAYVSKDIEFSIKNVALFKPNNKIIDGRYLSYLITLPSVQDELKKRRSGSAQPFLSLENLRSFKIKYHKSLVNQKLISSILSAFDDLIENNLKRIKLLEEAAELIYKEWFVNLRFPGHENVKIVGGVPEGWRKGKVEEFLDVAGGGTPSTENSDYWENGTIPWYTPTDLSKSKFLILLKSEKLITDSGLKGSSARLMEKDTILMTSRATIGLFGLVEHRFCTNQGFINIIPRRKEDKYFLLFNFKNRIEEIKGIATGSTFLEISKGKFRSMGMIFPDVKILNSFFDILNPIIQLESNLCKQINKLQESRDLLLPGLMNGSIDVEKFDS